MATDKKPLGISTADYNARFQYIRKHKDFLLGECFLLKDKTHNRTVLAKEKIITSQNELQKQIKNCNVLAGLNKSPHITEFYGFTYKEAPQYGPNTWSFIELREFIDHDIERELASRLRDKDVFSEEDMWTMIGQLVSALSRLQASNVSHGHICPKTILFQRGEKLQVKINWTDFHPITYKQIVSGEVPFNTKCNLAPELVATLKKKKKPLSYDNTLADVFALGITIIALCTLGDIEGIYDADEVKINVNQIKSKLAWVRTIYSERLYFLLTKMLKIDTERRTDFRSLEDLMSYMTDANEVMEETGSPIFAKFGRSTSPGLSSGRRTITGFEVQKMRHSAKKFSSSVVFSPLSKRNTIGSNGFMTIESSSPIKLGNRMSPKPLNVRIEATVSSVFDKKGNLLKKEGFVSSEILLGELEKRLLQDPLTRMLKSGMQVKYFPDGAKYEGNMKGKVRDGIGINYYTNGNVYAGEWKNDKFHGRGVYFFNNGERYEGQLLNGMRNGEGVFYYQNKGRYFGTWKDDKKHGKGVFQYGGSKETYEGEWANGMRHGEGTFYYASGDNYSGGWENDERSGNGILNYSNGGSYEGEWACNKPHGVGLMQYPNGERYEGYWEYGMKSGKGIYHYENESKYEGEWENDNKNGHGTLYHLKGERYTGEWKDGLKHGQGTYYYENGGVYQGDWESDFKNGTGVMLTPDGNHFEGEWVAGERCGNGILKLASGDIYEGEFKKDTMWGNGVYQWTNGDVYEGMWMKNKMHGKGRFIKRNGDHFKGIWEAQKLVKVVTVDDD